MSFGSKVLQLGGDCRMVGRRSEASCSLSLDSRWNQRVSFLQANEGQRPASHLANPVSVTSRACVEHLHGRYWEVGGKEKDKNIASDAKYKNFRSRITLSQFCFIRGLIYKKTFPQYKNLKSSGPHVLSYP